MSDLEERAKRRDRLAWLERPKMLPAVRTMWAYPWMESSRPPTLMLGARRLGSYPSAIDFREWIGNRIRAACPRGVPSFEVAPLDLPVVAPWLETVEPLLRLINSAFAIPPALLE